jgi:hypothetical protein
VILVIGNNPGNHRDNVGAYKPLCNLQTGKYCDTTIDVALYSKKLYLNKGLLILQNTILCMRQVGALY